jgi:O-antigen chain-terminating methyltransferase
VAIQVLEHLPFPKIQALFEDARRCLKPGGIVAFETIDPRSVLALSSNYFRDPTHVAPLHPETLAYALRMAGFVDVEIIRRSAVPEVAQLREIPQMVGMSPQFAEMIDTLNRNLRQLNDMLYGYQDYCVVGRKARS